MGKCHESSIVIDTSTLERIVYDPQSILDNEDAFWEDEKPQNYTKQWAEAIGYSIPFDKWREQIQAWAELTPGEREKHELLRNSRALIEGKEEFLERAIPHLCAFLPEDADLNVTVRLTAFIPPNAFAWQDIILNVNSTYWQGKVENILNLLVHEIFHAGFSYCRELRPDKGETDEPLLKMLDNIQSEGVCTYVGYRALPLFPAPDIDDYTMLENREDVVRSLADVNEAFSMIAEDEETLKKFVWERCIQGRAYYVAGAYMCQVIEENSGREVLIQTLVDGPVSFLRLYNSLVKDELQLRPEV